jgi:hypothetical protein
VGTYPYAEDVSPLREVNISSSLQNSLPLTTVIPDTTGNLIYDNAGGHENKV